MANTLGGVYQTGTVTVSVDRLTVVGVGTLWAATLATGDWLLIGGQVGLVSAVSDDTHLSLQSQWQGTLPSASAYVAVKMSWLRYDPALTQAKLRELLAALSAQGNFIFTSVAPPDPAIGQDGQWALKTDVSPWRLWYKTGGVWVEQKAPAGMNWRGAWSAATSYAPGDGVSRSGSSYISKTANTNKPPEANPSDWDLMAAQGAQGNTGLTGPPGMTWRGTWSGATAYLVNDAVALNGASYIAIAPNTNQAPPNATYWNVLAGASSATIANDSVTPAMLDAGTAPKQQAFRDRIVAAPVASPAFTGNGSIAGGFTVGGATPTTYKLEVVASAFLDGARITGGGGSTDLRLDSPRASSRNYGLRLNHAAAGDFHILQSLSTGADPFAGTSLFSILPTGEVRLSGTTASSNSSSGALIVVGGVGVGGGLNVGGLLTTGGGARFEGNLISTGTGVGIELVAAGGVGYLQSFNRTASTTAPLSINAAGTTVLGAIASSTPSTGAFVVGGGVGVGGALNVGGATTIGLGGTGSAPGNIILDGGSGNAGGPIVAFRRNSVNKWLLGPRSGIFGNNLDDLSIFNSIQGFEAALFSAANSALYLNATVASSNPSTGTLIVGGGVGVGGALNVGGASAVIGPGGTGGATAILAVDGGSGNAGGPALQFRRNGANKWLIGPRSGIFGNNLEDLSIYNGAVGEAANFSAANNTLNLFGDVTIGKASPTLALNSTSGTGAVAFKTNGAYTTLIQDNGGALVFYSNPAFTHGVYLAYGSDGWTSVSDARLPYKRSARDITERLPSLDRFRLYENEVDGALQLFVKAQEVDALFPHVVRHGSGPDDYEPTGVSDLKAWGMSYDRLGAVSLAYARQHASRLDRIERELGLH